MKLSRQAWMMFVLGIAAMGTIGSFNAPDAGAQGRDEHATITFLTASCPADSALAVAVTGGKDPTAADNGTRQAVPSDIDAYGCQQVAGGYGLYLFNSSSRNATFTDPALDTAATRNANDDWWDGTATVISPGESFFAPADKKATRRFSVAEFRRAGTAWVGLPFLDLQCHIDGSNNDNADGAGWNPVSLAAGEQVYCIFYFADMAPEPTPTPEPTAEAEDDEDVAGEVSGRAVSKELHPDVKVDEETGLVTWIIRPLERGTKYYVWDAAADSCQAFGGAKCGGIGRNDKPGEFNPGQGNDQLLIVTQQMDVVDGHCEPVQNTVEWAVKKKDGPADRESLTAEYRCSGANALGWPLLAGSFAMAVGVAWYVARRTSWGRS